MLLLPIAPSSLLAYDRGGHSGDGGVMIKASKRPLPVSVTGY
jgi:hypothetical protein